MLNGLGGDLLPMIGCGPCHVKLVCLRECMPVKVWRTEEFSGGEIMCTCRSAIRFELLVMKVMYVRSCTPDIIS